MQTDFAVSQNSPDEPTPRREIRIPLMEEKGTIGLKEWGGFIQEAFIPKLYWPQAGQEYMRLRTSTPAIVMTAHQFVAWSRTIKPIVNLPENPTDDDKRYQDFRQSDLENMEGGFGKYLEAAIGRVPFDGFYDWMICYSRRDPNWIPPPYVDNQGKAWADDWRSEADDGLIGIRRLAPRDNSTFWRWDLDGSQKMIGWYQRNPNTGVEYHLGKNEILHHTFGDPHNPEGNAGLQPCFRLERFQYGLQTVYGIAAEHAAGYISVTKSEKGELSPKDEELIKHAVRYILTAQEGNVAIWPYGFDAKLIETTFTAAPALLEAIKHFDIMMLSVFGMQWMALNTLTSTGARAAQTDVTNQGITSFNAMTDGLASQWNDQIEKRIYNLNKLEFPNLTKRPTVTFSNLENAVPLADVAAFFSQMSGGHFPMGEDDLKAIRKQTGFLPENSPEGEDIIIGGKEPAPAPPPGFGNNPSPEMNNIQKAVMTKEQIQKSLSFMSRR